MHKHYLKKIGNNIKNARKDKKLSQEKLAEKIGKTRNYIGMVERAEINPSICALIDIAKALDVEAKVFWEF